MIYAPWGFGDSHAQNGFSIRNLENIPHIFYKFSPDSVYGFLFCAKAEKLI